MLFSTVKASAIGIFLLAVSVAAAPSGSQSDVYTIRLDNGTQSVEVTYGGPQERSIPEDGALVARQSSIDCKGSAFCERLGHSCDDALRKINPAKEYATFPV